MVKLKFNINKYFEITKSCYYKIIITKFKYQVKKKTNKLEMSKNNLIKKNQIINQSDKILPTCLISILLTQ